MGAVASQITSLTIAYSPVYSDADQRKYQSSASVAFVRGIHRGPVNYPHKWPVMRKLFPFDDVIKIIGHPGWTMDIPSSLIRQYYKVINHSTNAIKEYVPYAYLRPTEPKTQEGRKLGRGRIVG